MLLLCKLVFVYNVYLKSISISFWSSYKISEFWIEQGTIYFRQTFETKASIFSI